MHCVHVLNQHHLKWTEILALTAHEQPLDNVVCDRNKLLMLSMEVP